MDGQKDICQYHLQDHSNIGDLKDAVKVIIDGQHGMRGDLLKLTEAFKNMDRLEIRLDKMEEERVRQGEKRDKEIEELKSFMNKALGWLAAAVAIGSIGLKFIGV